MKNNIDNIISESIKKVLFESNTENVNYSEYDIKNVNGDDIEMIHSFQVLNIEDSLFDKHLYDKNGKYLGRLYDMFFVYDIEKNDLI